MPGTARPTKQKDQVKEQEREENKDKKKETSPSCGTGKSSCCG